MNASPESLSERKEAILQAVIEEYMATARPVGSSLVAGQTELSVSSATIRKELGALEDEGFLHQPHTSAGRVPTNKGYRYYIDTLMKPTPLEAAKFERIESFFSKSHGELERILKETSKLLAGVTAYTAVVLSPTATVASVKSVQLVPLAPQLLLMVVVMSNGVIERCDLELEQPADYNVVQDAQKLLCRVLIDHETLLEDSSNEAAELAQRVLAAFRPESQDPTLHVGGRSKVATSFDQTERVAELLGLFERQLVVVSLIRDVLDRGLRVAIGSETGSQDLKDCALVLAPYQFEGTDVGSIGVLGPTHMNYPQAVAAVAVVSNQLSDLLTRG